MNHSGLVPDFYFTNIKLISDVEQCVFDYIYFNYQYVDSVIAADDYAKSILSNTSSTEYKTALCNYSKAFTILMFKNTSHALTELIYTAWAEAGSPEMTATGIDNSLTESKVILEQNFPNPFANSTTTQFRLKENSKVFLQITDISGRRVSTLINELKTVGDYSVVFNSEKLSSGIYYLILDTEKEHIVKKMIVTK